MDKFRARVVAHWREAAAGGVAGAVAAWIVMVAGQATKQGHDLIINSDVIGAAIGAFLAVTGAFLIEWHRRAVSVQSAKDTAQQAARDLLYWMDWFDNYLREYHYADDDGRTIKGEMVPIIQCGQRARRMLQEFERAAITFDMAASLALVGDPAAMIPIAHLSRSVKAGKDGLAELAKIEMINGKKNPDVAALAGRGWDERSQMRPDLREYAEHMRLWEPSRN